MRVRGGQVGRRKASGLTRLGETKYAEAELLGHLTGFWLQQLGGCTIH